MRSDYPPRPCWNHPEVKAAVAAEFVDEVRQWAELHGAVEGEPEDREFLVAVTLALQESPDAYQAGRYLEDFYEWLVTGDLIRILDRAYARMKTITRKFELEWVMENNVRFPAKKGEGIRCRIGDVELGGDVVEVIRSEARAIVKLRGSGKLMPILAEDVQQVTRPSKKPPPVPPQNEPDIA